LSVFDNVKRGRFTGVTATLAIIGGLFVGSAGEFEMSSGNKDLGGDEGLVGLGDEETLDVRRSGVADLIGEDQIGKGRAEGIEGDIIRGDGIIDSEAPALSLEPRHFYEIWDWDEEVWVILSQTSIGVKFSNGHKTSCRDVTRVDLGI